MILKIHNKELENKIKNLLEDSNGGVDYDVYTSSFDAFLNEELKSCRDNYEGTFGKDTLDRIEETVSDVIYNSEIDFVSDRYLDGIIESMNLHKAKTIACCPISNSIAIELKDINDDEAVFTCGNDVYISETVIDGEDNECIQLGEMLIPLKDFIRTDI